MSLNEFVKAHEEVFFLDKAISHRRVVLRDAYAIMKKTEPESP